MMMVSRLVTCIKPWIISFSRGKQTNEGSQALILKSLPSLGLLHSLALERCFLAEQMSKSTLKEVEGMYLYTPQINPTVTSQLSKTRTDRTRRSSVTVENQNDTAEWPDAPIRGDRTRPIVQEPYCTLTWRSTASDQWWPDASGQLSTLLERDRTRPVIFQSRPIILLPSETRVRLINASGPCRDRVRSTWLKTQWLLVLTGRVRSWQRSRPVKGKQLKRLRNATQLEPKCFQLNFELFLSYLVLSLTSMHHT
jgi:hypothetical protein